MLREKSIVGHLVGLGTKKGQIEGNTEIGQAHGWSAVDYMYFGEELSTIREQDLFQAPMSVEDNRYPFNVSYIAKQSEKSHWAGWCVSWAHREC